jgi:RimJ/RimL family protein N-acetyltransferase
MKSDILESCKIEIKEPSKCSEEEISQFYEKVKKGGKVMIQGLKDRIKNCELLAFCYFEDSLVGVSSIKRPTQNYVTNIIAKTKIDRKIEDLTFEIGYSFTESDYRRNGISKELKRRLLKTMEARPGIIFSTTAVKSSQHFLEGIGFKKFGISYDGENDKGISYYERS